MSDAQQLNLAAIARRTENARRRALQVAPILKKLREQGKTLRAIARELNRRGIRAGRGGPWQHSSVWNVLALANREAKRASRRDLQ